MFQVTLKLISLIALAATVKGSKSINIVEVTNCTSGEQLVDVSGITREKLDKNSVLKGNLKVTKTLPEDTLISHKTYVWFNNEWIYAPISLTINLCQFVEMDNLIYPSILKHVDLPNKCPIMEGEYPVINGKVEGGRLTALIPTGNYKILSSGISKGTTIFCVQTMAEIR